MLFVVAVGSHDPEVITLPPDYMSYGRCMNVGAKILRRPMLVHDGIRYGVIAASCTRRVDV